MSRNSFKIRITNKYKVYQNGDVYNPQNNFLFKIDHPLIYDFIFGRECLARTPKQKEYLDNLLDDYPVSFNFLTVQKSGIDDDTREEAAKMGKD